jgi:exopolyphosphatase/guanosine-5'-triphosphate,3'-diphosphate pyrophosphatase
MSPVSDAERMALAANTAPEQKPAAQQPNPVAVIDIGTTSIRMTIAEIGPSGAIRTLDTLQQAVSIGKDTFIDGSIKKATIEECVSVLRQFKRVLDEYGISREEQVRAVATTAVREAANRDAFIDRISIANGITVEVIEDIDVARLTYLSLRSYLAANEELGKSDVVIAEMGGGNTEVLLLQSGSVAFSQSYRLGSLRLLEMLETFRASSGRKQDLVSAQIQRTLEQIGRHELVRQASRLVALGGDMRSAAGHILPSWDHSGPARITVTALARFVNNILPLSANEIAVRYHVPFPEAETIGPVLVFYLRLAKMLSLKELLVIDASMRHGALLEMSRHNLWSEGLRSQIILSALEVARKYQVDEAHAMHVASTCNRIFGALAAQHRLDPWHNLVFTTAALLHDAGLFISSRSHHKHSMYLINNSEIFGLSRRDITMVALVARYHRRAIPRPTHPEYMALGQKDRIAVAKMAAMLRVADALDRSHSQRIRDPLFQIEDNNFIITAPQVADLSLEQLALQNKGPMFENVFGMTVVLRSKKPVR